jgi:hypothetical protein
MMTPPQQNLQQRQTPPAAGVFFGIPLGDLGAFTSLLMALALGFISFFLFTFLGIIGLSIYNHMGHHIDLGASYKYFALPAGSVVLVASLLFFATLWMRRKVAGR